MSTEQEITRELLEQDAPLAATMERIFGSGDDPIEEVDRRARLELPGRNAIVWEGDPATFAFRYVSETAEAVLGHAVESWLSAPAFWAESVVHPDDRGDAVAYCALATGQCRDHDFVYRALARDGRVVRLHDVVRVYIGPKGVADRIRGVMIPLE